VVDENNKIHVIRGKEKKPEWVKLKEAWDGDKK
jgi:hypothetical protein